MWKILSLYQLMIQRQHLWVCVVGKYPRRRWQHSALGCTVANNARSVGVSCAIVYALLGLVVVYHSSKIYPEAPSQSIAMLGDRNIYQYFSLPLKEQNQALTWKSFQEIKVSQLRRIPHFFPLPFKMIMYRHWKVVVVVWWLHFP